MKTVVGGDVKKPEVEKRKPNWVFATEDKVCGNCREFTPAMHYCGVPFDREHFRKVDRFTNACSKWERAK